MVDKKNIELNFDKSNFEKANLKEICLRHEKTNFDVSNVNLRIEILPNIKICLSDDLINFSELNNFSNITHNIEFILNDNSYLEYWMVLKPSLGSESKSNLGSCIFDKKLKFNFVGKGACAKIRMRNMHIGSQRFNLYTEQSHLCSKTTSCLCAKTILMNSSIFTSQNKIFVAKNLDDVFAKQNNHNFLLDPGGEVFTQPQLEVLSDNVKCKHGASIKSLDSEHLFYLGLRGLDFEMARKLLIDGFLGCV